jgi:hypothetical protein
LIVPLTGTAPPSPIAAEAAGARRRQLARLCSLLLSSSSKDIADKKPTKDTSDVVRHLLVSSLGLASIVIGTTLHAEDEGERFRLDYTADAGCPNRATFVSEVQGRTPRARLTDGGSEGRAIMVAARVGDGRARGTIDVGSGAPREISAENCAEVVSALALVAALVIDPDALVTSLPLEEALPPAPKPTPEPPDKPSAASSSIQLPSRRWGVGARLDASSGVADRAIPMVGFSAWFEGGVRVNRLFAPTLRLGGRAAFSPTIAAQGGAVRFRILAGQVDACPFRYEMGRAAFVPCVSVELGRLQATPDIAPASVTPRQAERTWLALDQNISFEFAAAGPVLLTLMVQLREPLSGYDFVFGTNPGVPIANVQGIELAAAIGAGIHFE